MRGVADGRGRDAADAGHGADDNVWRPHPVSGALTHNVAVSVPMPTRRCPVSSGHRQQTTIL